MQRKLLKAGICVYTDLLPFAPHAPLSLSRAYLSVLDLALMGITATRVKACQHCGGVMVGR